GAPAPRTAAVIRLARPAEDLQSTLGMERGQDAVRRAGALRWRRQKADHLSAGGGPLPVREPDWRRANHRWRTDTAAWFCPHRGRRPGDPARQIRPLLR